MKVDKTLVEKLAHLARLEFDEQEKERIRADLEKILDFVDKLNELDTEGVEPLAYITEEKNVLRKDVAKHTISKEDALKNAPQKDSDYFKVPKVLQKNNGG